MSRASFALAALLLAAPAFAAAPEVEDVEPAAPAVADEHLAELTGTLEALLVVVAAERPDALSIPEAEEMAAVAEELIEEGEADLAGSLLEEAIALLEDEAG
jgi:hypothetical protein